MHLKGMYINSAKQKQKQKQKTNKESHRTDSFLK
jgi:hypothetical protein